MRRSIFLFVIAGILILYYVPPIVYAQESKFSQNLTVEQELYAATGDQLPLWLHANTFATVPVDAPGSVTSGLYGAEMRLGDSLSIDSSLGVGFSVADGVVAGQLRQADIGVQWRFLELRGGVFPYTRGEVPIPDLTTGSMVVSGNASPLPLIQLTIPSFVPIPFTNEMLNMRGGIAHGWFTGDRYVQNILLHEKWLYLGLGNENTPVQMYGGLIHEAMWGGTSEFYDSSGQPAPPSLENFRRVFLNDEGGSDGPAGESLYRIGNSLGAWDVGVRVDIGWAVLHGYHQHYFEDGTALWLDNRMDGLSGIGIEIPDMPRGLPNRILHERVYTTDQGGPYHNVILSDGTPFTPGGNDSHYYHSIYKTGWSHQDRILGTPLFVLLGEGDNARIASNRIKAQHFGLSGDISEAFHYRIFTTHVFHYPAYSVATVADSEEVPLWQWHHMLELQYDGVLGYEQFGATISLGLDVGQVYDDSFGVGFGLRWEY